jgi:branched-chain amino acid transport system permease protein
MSATLVRTAELLAEQWWTTALEGLTQGAVYALLALACTRRSRWPDLVQPAAFTLGLFTAYLTCAALGFRPGPTPVFGSFTAFALVTALAVTIAVTVAASSIRGHFLVGLGVFLVVQAAVRLLRGSTPEAPLRLFRPHELFPGFDTVQLTVWVAAFLALAITLRQSVPPFVASGTLTGVAAFLYLLKVPGAAWYLTAVLVGIYAVTAALLARSPFTMITSALALGLVQVCFETFVGARWWLPFSLGLLALAAAYRFLRTRFAARRSPVAVA